MVPEGAMPRPTGKPVAEKVYGCVPPVAATVTE
jgi:hypothetical protein